MLKKISVMRMEVRSAPIQDGPASPARDPGHAANRVDDAGMADRFQRRQVAGTGAIHEAGAKVESLLGGEPNGRQSRALAVGIRVPAAAREDCGCARQSSRNDMTQRTR